ncbi:hypothetical protein [Kitasatospora phosalacinea]|nr:hypothetical protein [Kitasatospora phosalacinea]
MVRAHTPAGVGLTTVLDQDHRVSAALLALLALLTGAALRLTTRSRRH